jgi:tetratricopeptide (TPR) repeat protein
MGVVYTAYDPELDRKVAIKILHRGHAERDAATRARLQREAQAMARLNHPNVLTIYDVGEHAGRVFLAVEFVEGEDLERATARRRGDWRAIVGLYVQAGRGLAAAHAAGLVHRDFKPQNVMVAGDGRVRVMDFGLAQRAEGADEEDAEDSLVRSFPPGVGTLASGDGAIAGTPAYMAPEQFGGRPAEARTDQFGYCVALWEALHGERPFAGESPAAIALAVTEGKIREPTGERRVPAALRRVLRRGLSVRPEDRWPSLDPLLGRLEGVLAARRRWRIVGAVAGMGALAIGLGSRVAGVGAGPACDDAQAALAGVWDPARKAAVERAFAATDVPYAAPTFTALAAALDSFAAQWAATYQEACEATHVRGEQSPELFDLRMRCLSRARQALGTLVDRLEKADPAMLSRATFAASGLPTVETCSDIENLRMTMPASRDPQAEQELRRLIGAGNVAVTLGQFDEAEETAAQALAQARDLAHEPLEAEVLAMVGTVAEEQGRYEEAERHYTDSLFLAYRVGHDVQVAWVAGHLVTLASSRLARPEQAAFWGRMGEAALARYGEAPRAEARLWSDLGNLHLDQGRYDLARDYYDRAIARYVEIAGENHPAIGNIANNAGNVLFNRGDFAAAEREYERALVNLRANYGPRHPDVAATLHNLGNVYLQRGDTAGALAHYDQGLAMRRELLGEDHPATAATMSSLGVVHLRREEIAQARALFEGALAVFERSGGGSHPTAGAARINLAETWERDGAFEKAHAEFQRAEAIFRATLGPDHPYLAFAIAGRGRIALAQGRPEEALSLLEDALARDGAGDPELRASTQLAIARTLTTLRRDPARARELATAAREGFAALTMPQRAAEAEALAGR